MLIKENIIENIFCRFDPYFPGKKLPAYDINPADPQDFKVQLGASLSKFTHELFMISRSGHNTRVHVINLTCSLC